MKVVIERFLECKHGTFGTLSFASAPGDTAGPPPLILFTAEPNWRNNEHMVSCIPPGPNEPTGKTYILRSHHSPKLKIDTFEVTGVPDRGSILLHPGNTEENTEGCILLGMKLGVVNVATDMDLKTGNKKLGVVQSKTAWEQFMAVAKDGMEITVRWVLPGEFA